MGMYLNLENCPKCPVKNQKLTLKKIKAEGYPECINKNYITKLCSYSSYYYTYKCVCDQNIIVNIGGEQVSFDVQKIEEISKKNSELESENQRLLEQIEQQNISPSNGNVIADQNSQGRAVYLNELAYFNCQYYSSYHEEWCSASIPEWNTYEDKAADGKLYNNAVHMSLSSSYGAKTIVIDYLLDSEYKIFNGSFMLDEISKSTPTVATLRIYGDDLLIYECANITGEFIPQNTGDISVENVQRLRFEFSSESGHFVNRDDFGVVFYDSILEHV